MVLHFSSGVDEENLTANDNRMSSTDRRSQNKRVEFTRLLGLTWVAKVNKCGSRGPVK